MTIAERVARVRERIDAAARRAGRAASDVTLVAASKTVPPEVVLSAHRAGIALFGENRVQEAEAKAAAIESAAEVGAIRWHLIGPLQRNKARRAVALFELIHSVDSVRLGETLDRLGRERGTVVEALLEVNVGGEASKAGVAPGGAAPLARALSGRDGLRIRGLMTIPPPVDDPDDARPYFRALRAVAAEIAALRLPGVAMHELSMGMTDDFETAIEEGATMIRVGRALFGPRR